MTNSENGDALYERKSSAGIERMWARRRLLSLLCGRADRAHPWPGFWRAAASPATFFRAESTLIAKEFCGQDVHDDIHVLGRLIAENNDHYLFGWKVSDYGTESCDVAMVTYHVAAFHLPCHHTIAVVRTAIAEVPTASDIHVGLKHPFKIGLRHQLFCLQRPFPNEKVFH